MKRLNAILSTFTFSCLLLLSTSAPAFNTYYPQGYQTRSNPVEIIQGALDKLKTFSADRQQLDPALIHGFIETEIIPYFAFDRMTWWIAGPYARQMSHAELSDLETRVKQTFLRSLATHLGSFDAEQTRISFRPPRYRGPDEATVSAFVSRSYAPPARLEFRMQAQDDQWKIIDVKANGTSAVIYYRNHFMSTSRPQPYPDHRYSY